MTPWISLAVSCLLGAIAYLWERGRRITAEKHLAEEKLNTAFQRNAAIQAQRNFDLASEDVDRLRQAMVYKHEEIEALSLELASCSVPGAAADRLNRLLKKNPGE